MLDETWQTTYERLWRSFVKLREVVEDTRESDRIEARNSLVQFCRFAFELRDWILAADVDPAVKESVRRLFGKPSDNPAKRLPPESYALAACADIANESKHAVLDRPSYSNGVHAEITYEHVASLQHLEHFAIALINNPPRFGDHQWMWLINAGGTDYDALLLAEDAMKDWEACLVGHGLVEPEIGV